ncbi:MAG TPA: zinc-dependent metalloprotease [Dermatophilaceae bacterium]|nr:zinc-dependent metalloprotease [Dermatophilaceae bacterium]
MSDHSDHPDRSSGDSSDGPSLEDLIRMLGSLGLMPGGSGAQGGPPPDLERMLREVLGPDAQLPPEVRQVFAAMQQGAAAGPAAAMIQQQMQAFFGGGSAAQRLASATDLARKVLAAQGDPSTSEADRRAVADAVGVAQLWLDPVTALPATTAPGRAWSGAEWVEATMPHWQTLVEPVADGVGAAVTAAMRGQLEQLGEAGGPDLGALGLPGGGALSFEGIIGQLTPAFEQLSQGMFSAQTGQAVGGLAGDVLSATEIGLPLVDDDTIALLPARVAAFADDVHVDLDQVRLYLAVREAARARLFAHVPWLGSQLEAAVRDYGRHISIDTDAIEQAVRSADLQNPQSLQDAFSQAQLFGQRRTPEQQAALTRLEATLALVEGWVDLVTEQATAAHLPQAQALGEAVRRRRAGGPTHKTFAGLVGLELRPRRLRDARNLWAALESAGGMALRDSSWDYPDLAPTAADLDDPLGYVERRQAPAGPDSLDAELERLLSGELPPTPPEGEQPGGSPAP